uniref:THAP-type domain-containing protein n=1 Tax=Salarias fasciatus TaxID=181472 RepID=A0A672IZZ1_SALFA
GGGCEHPPLAVSIHSFPKDRNLRKKWEDACGRVQLPKYPYLCSRHFSADSFENFHRHQLMKELAGIPGYKRQLKKDAVPTIFVHKRIKRPRVSSESRFEARERREVPDACLHSETAAASASLTLAAATNDPTRYTEFATEETEVLMNTSVSVQCSPLLADASTQTEMYVSDVPSVSESLDTRTNPRVFLVYEDQLNELLLRCMKCGSPIIQEYTKEFQNEGSQLTLELTCSNNCTYSWQSQPPLSATKGAGNILLSASIFFSGIHFAKFDRFCSNMNLKTISEDTYAALRKKHVFPVINKTWIAEQEAVLSEIKSQEEVVLCGDGRCDSPGHSAKYCTYTFLDAQSSKVVDFNVVSVTEVKNSNAMELKGFKGTLKNIQDKEVRISTISTDRHPQIVKEMKVNNPDISHEFDPWHVAKGVSKKLTAEAKRKGCEDLGAWIPSIISHLWWSAQTCEEDAVLLKEKWVSVIHHVTNRHDWPGNRLYHRCAHEPLDEESQRNKLWMKSGTEAHTALVKIATDKRLLSDLDHLTKCVHTTTLEVYHSMYLKYLPKRTHFGYDVMVHASMLAALDHNNNVNRKQVCSTGPAGLPAH